MAAGRLYSIFDSSIPRGKSAKLANPLPAGHEILVELHELSCRGQSFLFARQLEDRIAADDLLRLHERAVNDTQASLGDTHLRACSKRHEAAMVEQAAGFDFPVGKPVHRVGELWCRGAGLA